MSARVWAGLFNMVFAVLPPWGPWSDNVVPLVRLSRCLIRTANGASLAPRARPPPPAAIPALQLQKQRKDSTPGRCFPPPQEPGTSMQELHGGLDRPQSLAFSLRTSACPAWFLDHWPASREYFQAGYGPLQSCGREHGLEELSWHPDLPRTHLSLSPQPTVAFHFISMKSWKT